MSAEFDQENLLSIFVAEASDGMNVLAKALTPDDGSLPTPQHLHEQFIIAHRIKGAAALYGYDGVANLCEQLETLCERATAVPEDRWPAVVGVMREIVQGIQDVVCAVGKGEREDLDLIERCLASLSDLFLHDEYSTGSTSSAPMADPEYISPVLDTVTLSYFVQEAEEYLSVIEGVVPSLLTDSARDDSLHLLALTTHTLNVAARTIDFHVVGDIAQRLEGCVSAVQEKRAPVGRELLDALMSAISAIRILIRQDAAAMSRLRCEVPPLLRTLDRFCWGERAADQPFSAPTSTNGREAEDGVIEKILESSGSYEGHHLIAESVHAGATADEVIQDPLIISDPLTDSVAAESEEPAPESDVMELVMGLEDLSFTEPVHADTAVDEVMPDLPVTSDPLTDLGTTESEEIVPDSEVMESVTGLNDLSFTEPAYTEEVEEEGSPVPAVSSQAFSEPWLHASEEDVGRGVEAMDPIPVPQEAANVEMASLGEVSGLEAPHPVVVPDVSVKLPPERWSDETTPVLYPTALFPDSDEESRSHFALEAEELLVEMEGLIQILGLDATGEALQYFTHVTRSLNDIAVAEGFQVVGTIAGNMHACLTAVLEQRIPLNSDLLDAAVHGISLIRMILQRDATTVEALQADIPVLLDLFCRLRGTSGGDERSVPAGEVTGEMPDRTGVAETLTAPWLRAPEEDHPGAELTESVGAPVVHFPIEMDSMGEPSGEEMPDLADAGMASTDSADSSCDEEATGVGFPEEETDSSAASSTEMVSARSSEGAATSCSEISSDTISEPQTSSAPEAVMPIVNAEYILPMIDEDVLSYFGPEVEEYLAVIEELAPALRTAPVDEDVAHRLFRATHTLKGSAYTVDFHVIGDIAYPMEDCMIAMQEGRITCSRELSEAFIVASALVRHVLLRDSSAVEQLRQDIPVLIAVLRRLCEGQTGMEIPPVLPVPVSGILPGNALPGGRADSAQWEMAAEAESLADAPMTQGEGYLLPELDPEVLSYFVPEAEEYLETLEANLLQLDKDPQNRELINQLFRTAHTLKGSAYTVGFQAIGDLVHHVEDFMGAVRDNRLHVLPGHTDLILRAIDVVSILMRRDPRTLESTRRRFDTALAELRQLEQGHAVDGLPTSLGGAEVGQPWDRTPNLDEDEGRAVKQAEGKTGEERDVIRVSYARLERLMNLVGELVIGRGRLEQRLRMLEGLSDQVLDCKTRMIDSIQSFSEKHTFTFQSARSHPEIGVVSVETRGFEDFGGLELDKYDDFNILARRIGEVSADITEAMAQLSGSIGRAHEDMNALQQLTRIMRDEIGRARMVPIGTPFTRFRRAIRETARALDKQVSLVTSGEHTEVDTGVVEGLVDPLVHLVRNAVYHGIESQAERVARGKPPAGTIYLHAAHRGNSVVIEVEDDGGGLPVAKIREKAVTVGLVDREQARTLPDHEVFQYIFAPGFSTAEKVGDQAGRGVGLDVVKRAIEDMNGHIEVESEAGVGTKFTLILPLTLLITTALLVRIQNESYAFALSNIREVTVPTAMALEHIGDRTLLRMEEEVVEVQSLRQILYREPTSVSAGMPVVIVRTSTGLLGLAVDELLGRQEIVIKALGSLKPLTQSVFAGATIDPEGRVILVVDPSRLETRHAMRTGVSRASVSAVMSPVDSETGSSGDTNASILLIDDSLSIRKFVGRMLESAGYPVDTAVDGDDGIKKASEKSYRLVITDLEMPKFNGYEVVQALRARPQTSQTPIVVMTTRAGDKHRQLAFDIGANSYIAKPVDERMLLEEVERWVRDTPAART